MTTSTHALDRVAEVSHAAESGLLVRLGAFDPAPRGAVLVGADVQGVEAVHDALERHGERYLHHLFSTAEVRELGWPHAPTDLLAPVVASGFAAKEAVVKALAPRHRTWSWQDLEVVAAGPWEVRLGGSALDLASQRGVARWALSCVSDATHAVALAIGVGPVTHYAAAPPAELGGA